MRGARLQGLSKLNPDSTVMSIDGISAYDQISRAAMLDGLYTHCGGETIPFVRMFYGSPGENLVAHLDDIWVVSPVPERVSHAYGSLQRNLFSHARIRVHGGKTDLRDVMRWRGSRMQQTREPVFGVGLVRQICLRHSRDSWCWALLWETPLSSNHIWRRRRLNNAHCWNGSP